MRSGASRFPLVLTAAAVLVLLGIVALASSGSTPTGSDDARTPGDLLLDTIFSLGLVLLVPGAAMLIYGLTQRKAIAREIATRKYRRIGFPVFVALVLLYTALLSYGIHKYEPRPPVVDIGEQGFPGNSPAVTEPASVDSVYEPEFTWIPVLIVVALAAIAVGALVVSHRQRRPFAAPDDAAVAEQVAEVLDESLDDLRAEPDPRRAVIAAYARLERALAVSGLPRRQQETPEEYVSRILERLEVEGRLVRKLTDLYSWAKFSQHEVTHEMKHEAIAALEQIRDELRAAARRREEEHAEALSRHEQAVAG